MFKSATPEQLIANNIGIENPYIMGGIIFYGIIAVVYSFVISHTKYIERVIRLMSQKDGKKLAPKQSLMIARKIFKETVRFRLALFSEYYFYIALVYVVTFLYAITALWRFAFNDDPATPVSPIAITLGIAALITLCGWIYTHFFIAAKTRFVWFTYMSHYGDGMKKDALFTEVKRLNDINRKDDKEAIIGYIKRDTAADAGTFVVSAATDAVAPKILANNLVKGYTRGMAIDAAEYSKMKLNYEQYKEAYKMVFNNEPDLSKKLLEL